MDDEDVSGAVANTLRIGKTSCVLRTTDTYGYDNQIPIEA